MKKYITTVHIKLRDFLEVKHISLIVADNTSKFLPTKYNFIIFVKER